MSPKTKPLYHDFRKVKIKSLIIFLYTIMEFKILALYKSSSKSRPENKSNKTCTMSI